jgi:flagellin FlaB
MGKINDVLKEKEIGAIGIGAMIVFISMVLVAGIAASVLIQTSGTLETQAMQSGQETIEEVATGLSVEKISGYNASGVGKIRYLAIEVRPRAGSKDVDLSETVLEMSDSTTKNLFTYNSSAFTDTGSINGDFFTSTYFPNQNATTFTIIVLEDADSSCSSTNPVINGGDHVVLCVDVRAAFGSTGITTRVDVFGQVIPEEGSPGVISFTTPAAYNERIIDLQ